MKNSLLSRYGVAALGVGLALPLQRLLLVPLFGVEPNTSPFMAFFAAVTVAAWFGGLWPGLFATALSALLSWYFFLPPQHSFEIASLGQSLRAIVFVSEGALISSVVEALHTARRRAEASASEARRGQEDLRRNEERFRALVQNSSDIITVIDAEGTVRYVSPAVERMTGHRPEELVGKSVYHYVRPDDLEEAQGVFAELLSRPGVHPPFEFEVPHKNGSRRRFEFLANNLLDDPSVSGVVVNQRDITERTESEKRLREAETRFRTLVEQIPAVTYIEAIDRVGRATDLLYVSPQVEDLLGYPPEVWAADPQLFAKLLHPEDRERVLAEDRRTEETGEPFEVEYRQIARDGRVVWVRDEAVLIRDDEGMPLFWQGIQLDITGRKEAEKQLRESEELYRTVVEQAAEKIFIVDTEDKRILEANAAFYASLGYAPEELEGTTLYDLVAADPRSINANIQRIVEGHTFTGERRYRRKDGSLMDVEVSASLLYYGGKQAMCIVSHDVTERNRAEENLRRSLDALLALYEAGQVLGSSLKREEIGLRLLGIVERISGLEAAIISSPDEQSGLAGWRGVGPEGVLASVREEPQARAASREALERGVVRSLELRLSARSASPQVDGSPRVLTGFFVPLRVRDRVIGVLEAYGPEVLAEKETTETLVSLASQAASALENALLYEEVAERERQLHDLVRRLVGAQEEERRQVAYEVHDGLTQLALAAHQRLQMFAEDHPPGSAEGREALEELSELVRRTVGEARRVIADLRPTALDDFGLAAAVRMQLDNLRAEGYETSYEEALGDERLPAIVETTLFRIVQEALTNARKHAKTDRLRVALERREDAVRLEVRDWGSGFDPTEISNGGGPGERVGLSSMRERINLLGGDLEIRSTPGEGTSVVAEVTLPNAKGGDAEHGG